jgi:hypothetical protein
MRKCGSLGDGEREENFREILGEPREPIKNICYILNMLKFF